MDSTRDGNAMWVALRSGGLCALCAALCSCAMVSWRDADDVRHVVGLVHVTLPKATAPGTDLAAATTLGISITRGSPDGSALALGYSRTVLLSLSQNACVDLAQPGPCAGRASAQDRGTPQ